MPKKNDLITLEITQMTNEGSGLGRYEGIAIFVPASAVGDILLVRIVKVRTSFCYGKIEEILTPSPDRIPPDCPVSQRCGGCVFRHIRYEAELRHKQSFVQENLSRIGGIQVALEPIIPSPARQRCRNKAQYPVRMVDGHARAGFFAPRTHNLVPCEDCLLQPAGFAHILRTILSFADETNLSLYDEQTGKGLLRHIYIREGVRSGERMVCLVINGDTLPDAPRLVERLLACGENVVSILLNINRKATNVILGEKQRILYGSPFIVDTLCGLEFSISAHSFYQVNSKAAELLFAQAAEYAALDGTQTLLDLYCGTGIIGLSMAGRCKQVIGVEAVQQAVENAKAAAAHNGIENARFLCADAAQAAAQLRQEGVRPQVVILDPPRKGCGEPLLETVAQMQPERIVYISCNSATLARDCAALSQYGYRVARARPADFFPRTTHVETVCLLVQEG